MGEKLSCNRSTPNVTLILRFYQSLTLLRYRRILTTGCRLKSFCHYICAKARMTASTTSVPVDITSASTNVAADASPEVRRSTTMTSGNDWTPFHRGFSQNVTVVNETIERRRNWSGGTLIAPGECRFNFRCHLSSTRVKFRTDFACFWWSKQNDGKFPSLRRRQKHWNHVYVISWIFGL